MIAPRSTGRRLSVTVLVVFAVIVLFGIRLVDLQVVRAAELTAQADSRRDITVTTYGTRGAIVDAEGAVLASSVDRFDITASPQNVDLEITWMTVDGERAQVPTAEAIAAIAGITGVSAAELLAVLTEDPESNFAYLAREVDLATFDAVRALGISWVYSEPHPARTYPNGAVAGNLVGFEGTDEPLAGLERSEDACVAAENGSTSYERGADGVRIPGSTIVEEEPVDGGTLHLTIDSDLQWYAQQVLAREGGRLGAEWATAMIVRVDSGEIVAAADWPSIDPNDLNSVAADDAGARSFVAPFEPGSIMKPATFASLLDAGVITPGTQVIAGDRYTTGLPAGYFIRDSTAHGDLRYTAAGVLANSSNTGTAVLSERLDVEARSAYLEAFGFGSATAVDFLGEVENSGFVADPATVDSITAVTQQFGQGMTATSAQLVSMYQTLGNGGVRMPLTLVAGCELPDGSWTDLPDTEGVRVVSEYAADTTVAMMESTVTSGTLQGLVNIPGYRIAGKTGTAEVAEGGVYTDDRIISVAGLVPADDPQYAVVVTFAKPATIKWSSAAAPAFTEIVKQVIKTAGIAPSNSAPASFPLTW